MLACDKCELIDVSAVMPLPLEGMQAPVAVLLSTLQLFKYAD